ncbi:GerAB/ArcD/ProY family transporter [Paenibacillus methanolicus]|uniref:Spore germination protein (Amino acid permease) n=1 Tax=Paenibacillus methanolicus TaxID=582686 RepID=A0A5S5CL32_9BACL|nr:endospore germination permease [Paenibacillus methanolicus]TYP79241.1 spore germination protein (amino acid permease) [Paenibacillus methanolicus]
MKKYALNDITLLQYIMINFGMAVSFGFIELPAMMATEAGTDGWIPILIGGFVTMFASLVVIRLMQRFPEGTFFDMLAHYLGKWAGKTAALAFALYFLLYAYDGLIYTIRLIKGRLLPETPAFLIALMLMLPTYTIARNGLRIVGRYAEFAVMISLWIPFVYLYTLENLHPLYLLPVFKEGWKPILSAVPGTFFYYLGFVSSVILYPFLKHKKHASAGLVIANGITVLSYLFITLVCYMFLSPDEAKLIHQPSIYVLKSIELSFIEQVEGLFIAFYAFIFSLSWIPPLYFTVFCTSWMMGKQEHRPHLRVIVILFAVSTYFYLPTYDELENISQLLGVSGIAVEYLFPGIMLVFLWIYVRLRKGRNWT